MGAGVAQGFETLKNRIASTHVHDLARPVGGNAGDVEDVGIAVRALDTARLACR